jgi:hypothetical protein
MSWKVVFHNEAPPARLELANLGNILIPALLLSLSPASLRWLGGSRSRLIRSGSADRSETVESCPVPPPATSDAALGKAASPITPNIFAVLVVSSSARLVFLNKKYSTYFPFTYRRSHQIYIYTRVFSSAGHRGRGSCTGMGAMMADQLRVFQLQRSCWNNDEGLFWIA